MQRYAALGRAGLQPRVCLGVFESGASGHFLDLGLVFTTRACAQKFIDLGPEEVAVLLQLSLPTATSGSVAVPLKTGSCAMNFLRLIFVSTFPHEQCR